MLSVYLRDPDGNGIELYYDRPQTRWFDLSGEAVMKYCAFVAKRAWCTRAIQGSRWVASAIRPTGGVARIDSTNEKNRQNRIARRAIMRQTKLPFRRSVCISLDRSYLSHRLSCRLLGIYNPNPWMGGGAVATFTKCERPLYQSTFRFTTITTASIANNISDPRMSALSSLMSSPYIAP
jgi:hypothetical protein